MSRFLDTITGTFVERQDGGREVFRLTLRLRLELGPIWSGIVLYVPAGFETDFASVPRFFWRILPPIGSYKAAAVVHDFLYAAGSKVTRRLADAIFYEAMYAQGVSAWKRVAMYWAVRMFGFLAFHGRGATWRVHLTAGLKRPRLR